MYTLSEYVLKLAGHSESWPDNINIVMQWLTVFIHNISLQAIGISVIVAIYFIVRAVKTRGRRKAKK